ncbi:hypothetical protein PTMSG1_00662 [Pyrenophora teres f. maculata]|nr:hypothetical protein PTMSG1_00662 [Pyrenophora teres f. maculata]
MKLSLVIGTAVLVAHPAIAAVCLGFWIRCECIVCDASCPHLSNSGCGCAETYSGFGDLSKSECRNALNIGTTECPWTGNTAPKVCSPISGC